MSEKTLFATLAPASTAWAYDPLAMARPSGAALPAFLRFEGLSKSYQEGDRTRVVLQDADAALTGLEEVCRG